DHRGRCLERVPHARRRCRSAKEGRDPVGSRARRSLCDRYCLAPWYGFGHNTDRLSLSALNARRDHGFSLSVLTVPQSVLSNIVWPRACILEAVLEFQIFRWQPRKSGVTEEVMNRADARQYPAYECSTGLSSFSEAKRVHLQ